MIMATKFFGGKRLVIPVPAAGSGYFATANTANKLSIYDMSANTFAQSIYAFSTDESEDGNAASNDVKAIFVRARGVSGNDTYKLDFATQALSAGALLQNQTTANSGWGCSNVDTALFGVASGIHKVDAYAYAADTTGTRTSTPTSNTPVSSAALGTDTDAYVSMPTGVATVNLDKWAYASDSRVSGGSLSSNINGTDNVAGNCVGNSTVGIFVNTSASNPNTSTYTYSSQTAANSIMIGLPNDNLNPGASNGTVGIMLMSGTQTCRWRFATSDFVAGGALGGAQSATASAPGVSSFNPGVNI